MTKNELTTHIINMYLITDDEGAVHGDASQLKNIHKVSNHKNSIIISVWNFLAYEQINELVTRQIVAG